MIKNQIRMKSLINIFITTVFVVVLTTSLSAEYPYNENPVVLASFPKVVEKSDPLPIPSVWDGIQPQKNFMSSVFAISPEDDSAEWKANELNMANELFNKLPLPFRICTKGIRRVKEGSSPQVAGYVEMNVAPIVYITNSGASYKVFSGYLAHEMTHCFQMSHPDILSAWEKQFWTSSFFISEPKTAPVSDYGAESPKEDMAESVRLYCTHSSLLKSSFPDRYEFVKKYIMNESEFPDEKID
ncbi:MAG: hypothetical protein HQM08_10970 [Candidatus Riflebacteria bacterium]|nr:hypothetical protein [Candidatus Riflebacteria bacterium]